MFDVSAIQIQVSFWLEKWNENWYVIICSRIASVAEKQVILKVFKLDESSWLVATKVIHPNSYKNFAYALEHEMSFVCLSLFSPKNTLKQKFTVFQILSYRIFLISIII